MKSRGIFLFIFCFISVFLFTQIPKSEKKHSHPLLSQAPPGLSSIYESDRDVKTKGRHFQMPRSFYTSKDSRKKDYKAGVQAKNFQITGLSCVQIGPTGGDVVAAEVHNNNLYILTKGYPSKLYRFENDAWKKVLSINERCYGFHINNNGDICIPGKSKLHVLRSGEESPTSISYPEGFAITTSGIDEYAPYRIDSSPSDPNNVWVAGEKDNQASVARLDISSGTVSVVSVRTDFASSIQQGDRQVSFTVAKDQINPSSAMLGGCTYYADGTTAPWLYYTSDSGSSWTGCSLAAGTEYVIGARACRFFGDQFYVLTEKGICHYQNGGASCYSTGVYASSMYQYDQFGFFGAGYGNVWYTSDQFASVNSIDGAIDLWGNCCTVLNGECFVGHPLGICCENMNSLTDGVPMPECCNGLYGQYMWRESDDCSEDPFRIVGGFGPGYVDTTGQIIPGTCGLTLGIPGDELAQCLWTATGDPGGVVVIDLELTLDDGPVFVVTGQSIYKGDWYRNEQNYQMEAEPWTTIPELYHLSDIELYTENGTTHIYGTGAKVENEDDWGTPGNWDPVLWHLGILSGTDPQPNMTSVTDRPGVCTLGNFYGVQTGLSKMDVVVELFDGPPGPPWIGAWGVYTKEGEGDFQQQGNDLNGIESVVDFLTPIVVQAIQSKAQTTTYTAMIGTSEGPYGFDGTDWIKLADFHVSDLEESTSYSKIVFAGGQDGLYFTDNFGVTWQEIELQPADESEVRLSDEDDSFEPWITSVHLDDKRKALFIGTWGSSTLRLDVASLFKKILTISAGTGGTTDPSPGDHEYNIGQEVTIKANPSSGYTFSKWTGDVPSGKETTNPVAIIMDAVKSITANFTQTSTGGGGEDTGGEGGGGCFIATASYGTPMAEEVKVLSAFRDKYLITDPVGQAFVKLYHKHSPAVADFIRDKEQLKAIVRESLKPFIFVISNIVE